jgi:hypothetical protein
MLFELWTKRSCQKFKHQFYKTQLLLNNNRKEQSVLGVYSCM